MNGSKGSGLAFTSNPGTERNGSGLDKCCLLGKASSLMVLSSRLAQGSGGVPYLSLELLFALLNGLF